MSARLMQTIAEKDWERVTDPERRHPRQRTEDEVAAEFPDVKRPQPLVHEHKGQRFIPHGTNSIGTILSHPRSRRSVQFRYRHDPDSIHSMPGHEFNDRFARLLPPRRRKHGQRTQAAGVRHVRPTPTGILNTVREAA